MTGKAHKMFWMPNSAKCCYGTPKNWFVTRSASIAQQLVVVLRTVQFALVFMTVPTSKFAATFFASVMFGMQPLTMQGDKFSNNWLFASCAHFRWRSLQESLSNYCLRLFAVTYSLPSNFFASRTKDLPFILFVRLPCQSFPTPSTSKVMRMKFFPHC